MSQRIIVPICVAIVALVLFLIIGGNFTMNHYREIRTFSQSKWLSEPNSRNLISSDLLINYPLIGMTRKEIRDLLGPDDEKYTNGFYMLSKNSSAIDYYHDNDSGLFYYLDKGDYPDYPIPEDVAGLYFVFDVSGRCTDFAIVHFRT